MKEENKPYYKKGDIIGNYLKNQRHQIVLSFVKGYLIDLACGDNQRGCNSDSGNNQQ